MATTVQRLPMSMSSLPIATPDPAALSPGLLSAPLSGDSSSGIFPLAYLASGDLASGNSPSGDLPPGEDERILLEAFRSFAETAGSLERCYAGLRSEVARLHVELAKSHAGLAQSLEENRAMRHRLDRILRDLPCGVMVVRANNEVTLINPEARRLLAVASDGKNSIAETAGDLTLVSLPDEVRELLEDARSGDTEQERRFLENADGEFWLAARHARLVNSLQDCGREQEAGGHSLAGQNEPASIFILRDVSESKKILREREKNRREQTLAEMSAILAHEVRNPLGSLELFAGLLAKATLPEEAHRWVEQVQTGLRTLSATVNNVLHFHSLPAPQRVPADLGCLLDWTASFLIPLAREARVELCLRNRLHGVLFSADSHRLEQVLLNLLLNALRAMPGGGWVEISGSPSCRENARLATISVCDTGPGLSSQTVARIFEPGFSTRPGSPGLGLAVCQKIVEQHGGTLTARNREGAGACFVMTFPLEEACIDPQVKPQTQRTRVEVEP